MQPIQRAKLIAAYQALNPNERLIVDLLAVYYNYCSLTQLGKSLAVLKVKDGNKILKSDAVRARLKPILKVGVVEEHAHSGTVRCHRGLAEMIMRRLVDDGQLESLIPALEQNTFKTGYYRYSNADQCIQEVRIEFYRGNYEQANNYLTQGNRFPGGLPPAIDLYLSWFLNPVDIVWFNQKHQPVFGTLLNDAALHRLLYLYQQPEFDDVYRQILDGSAKGERLELMQRLLLEFKLLQGDWQSVEQAIQSIKTTDPEFQALVAAMQFLRGDHASAVDSYEQALVAKRKVSGKRNAYFYGLAGVFYPLAVLKQDDAKRRAKLSTLLTQAEKAGSYWSSSYHFLGEFLRFLQGDLSLRDYILHSDLNIKTNGGFRESGQPESMQSIPLMAQVFLLLIKSWVKVEHFNRIDPNNQKLYSYLQDQGMQ